MRLVTNQANAPVGDSMLSSDWGSLGRLVQASALEAIATHFVEMGRNEQCQETDASADSESTE